MCAHLSALVGGILTSGWAGSIGCFIGPLIIWLVKKDTMPFVDDQGKEALNFNITVGIAFFVLFLLAVLTLGIGLVIAIPLWIIIGIAWLVFTIIAARSEEHTSELESLMRISYAVLCLKKQM